MDIVSKNFAEDMALFLSIFPESLREALQNSGDLNDLIEVIIDVGRLPEARYFDVTRPLDDKIIEKTELQKLTEKFDHFDHDNRAGIDRTLHRISAIRNRRGEIVGLTCRVGRAIFGTVDIVKDMVESGKNILLLGRPGIGKTTLLRESARILSKGIAKRVVIVDTSNEIAGDGDTPHPAVGMSRRMQVSPNREQYQVMIEAVENHTPEVIIIDEISTSEETSACRTIAERGVQLIATAHGNTLENVLYNPTISDLVGGITSVILSDEEASRRGTQKTVLERTSQPTFDVLIEIHGREEFAIYKDVQGTVDRYLRGFPVAPEIRKRNADGAGYVVDDPGRERKELQQENNFSDQGWLQRKGSKLSDDPLLGIHQRKQVRVFPFGISAHYLNRALKSARFDGVMVKRLQDASLILTTETFRKKNSDALRMGEQMNIPIYSIYSNTLSEVKKFVAQYRSFDKQPVVSLQQVEKMMEQVLISETPISLPAADARVRKMEHQLAARFGLNSESFGEEPSRFVVVYPPDNEEKEWIHEKNKNA
jgi:stage III sporulation protein AA